MILIWYKKKFYFYIFKKFIIYLFLKIASISGDGKILLWSLSNKLATPISGYALSFSRISVGGSSMSFCYSGGSKGLELVNKKIPSIESPLIVATESGKLFKCILSAPTPTKSKKGK